MTYEKALADFRVASAAHAQAQHQLRDQRFYAQNGMANSVGFAEMREYVARQNWLRAHEKLVALTPPAPAAVGVARPPQPTASAAPKPIAAKAVAQVARVATPPKTTKASLNLASYFADECRHSQAMVYARLGLSPITRS